MPRDESPPRPLSPHTLGLIRRYNGQMAAYTLNKWNIARLEAESKDKERRRRRAELIASKTVSTSRTNTSSSGGSSSSDGPLMMTVRRKTDRPLPSSYRQHHYRQTPPHMQQAERPELTPIATFTGFEAAHVEHLELERQIASMSMQETESESTTRGEADPSTSEEGGGGATPPIPIPTTRTRTSSFPGRSHASNSPNSSASGRALNTTSKLGMTSISASAAGTASSSVYGSYSTSNSTSEGSSGANSYSDVSTAAHEYASRVRCSEGLTAAENGNGHGRHRHRHHTSLGDVDKRLEDVRREGTRTLRRKSVSGEWRLY